MSFVSHQKYIVNGIPITLEIRYGNFKSFTDLFPAFGPSITHQWIRHDKDGEKITKTNSALTPGISPVATAEIKPVGERPQHDPFTRSWIGYQSRLSGIYCFSWIQLVLPTTGHNVRRMLAWRLTLKQQYHTDMLPIGSQWRCRRNTADGILKWHIRPAANRWFVTRPATQHEDTS